MNQVLSVPARSASSPRGTSNSNTRGSSYDRRRLRAHLVEQHGSATGKTVRCFWCKRRCRTKTPRHPNGTYELDRFPLCGHAGGRYRMGNVVPSCRSCNNKRCTVAKHCRASAPGARGWRMRKAAA